jgi:hypothetical protein
MSDLQRDLRSYGERLAELVDGGAVQAEGGRQHGARRAALVASCIAILALAGFALASRNDPQETPPSATGGEVLSVEGVEINVPSGWSADSSTNELGEVLYLRGERGGELQIVVRPVPSEPPTGEFGTVSAVGDASAVVDEVEGGYALYAELECPTKPCERVEVFGYDLSLDEFRAIISSL